jgi:hypothetical protein
MHGTEAVGLHFVRAVGERCLGVEGRLKGRLDRRQEIMSERVAIKQDYKPAHRKPKVSWGRLNLPGLVGS